MTRRPVVKKWAALTAGLGMFAAASWAVVTSSQLPQPEPGTAVQATLMAVEAPILRTPVAEEPITVVTEAPATTEALPKISPAERARMASEMSRWVTRHPQELVHVIADLAETQPLPLPPTYLLSIAWAETRGKILAISPAGAAGLAQATPAAYLSENFGGKVFVTDDYLMATRAFIMKKPLGDALSISAPLLRSNTPAARQRALALTASALELRQEGMDELEALRPVGNATFQSRIAEDDLRNLDTLLELQRIIERGAPQAELQRFRTRVQRDYTHLRNLQRDGWARYAKDLGEKRDALLRAEYGQPAATVMMNRPYEAGEFLGRALDARFSPSEMARFLAAHLNTKQQQARALGVQDEMLEAWTAALYNGGAVNVRRMKAGLIGTLTETQKYMAMVPARSAQLARTLG